jgi:hypothetical protein
MENNCEYVSSRGILKSCDIYSQKPMSSITQLIHYNFTPYKNGSIIYICSSALYQFKLVVLPLLPYKIILVTGDCDLTCAYDLFQTHADFLTFIENDKIIHWFSQNCTVLHPKLTQIPIGMDYHTMTTYYPKWGPKLMPLEQEQILKTIPRQPFWERIVKGYSNFHFFTTTKYGKDRINAIQCLSKDIVDYEPTHLLRESSWRNQVKYAFVISPHGNGLDCHRTWEALLLGCIPIVKMSALDTLYTQLPVLIVKDWADVTLLLLHEILAQFKAMTFNYSKLTLSYWVNKIQQCVPVHN